MIDTKVYDKAVKLIFLANGFSLATIIPHFPWIKQIHEMGDALMGFVLLFPAIGAVSMMLLTGNLIQRFGSKRFVLLGGILMQLCIPLILLVPSITFLAAILLVFVNVSLPSSTETKQVAWVLWPIFGASNQMLAALTLMVLTLYFWQKNKPVLALLIPMILVMLITIATLCLKAVEFYSQNTILFVIDLFLIVLVMWMIIEGIIVFKNKRKLNSNY